MTGPRPLASVDDLAKLDVRVGRIVEAAPFPEGRSSTHVLRIDFGPEIGVKKSLARLAPNYAESDLVGRLVFAVVNLPPRQIGGHRSEALTLGVPDDAGHVTLVRPDVDVPLGGRLH